MRKNLTAYILLSGILIAFFFFLVLPLFDVFIKSFFINGEINFSFFLLLFDNPILVKSISNSLIIGISVVVFSALISFPMAIIMASYRFRGKALFQGLLLVPLIMPPFVGAIGIKQIFARFGSFNLLLMKLNLLDTPIDWLGDSGFWGVILLETLHLYPIMYLNLVAAISNIDPSLEEAAYNLSASYGAVIRKIILPLITPGFYAGAIITFIWAFTDLGTPIILNFRETIPVQIYNLVTDMHQNQMGYVLVVFMAFVTSLFFLLSRYIVGNKRYEMLAKGHVTSRERSCPFWKQSLFQLFLLLIIVFALLPHIGVFILSITDKWSSTILPDSYTLEYYTRVFSEKISYISIKNSFLYSIGSVMADLVLGLTIAYLLTRTKIKGKGFLDGLAMLPLSLPGIVLAFGYVSTYSGSIIDPRQNPTLLLVISYAFRRLPYMVRAAYAGFQQSSVYLEEAARNLGASTLLIIRKITLPLITANMIAGGILCFAYAMLEVSDSLILAMKEEFFPITKAIYTLLSYISNGSTLACVLGIIGMVILSASLIIAGKILGKRLGELFRTG